EPASEQARIGGEDGNRDRRRGCGLVPAPRNQRHWKESTRNTRSPDALSHGHAPCSSSPTGLSSSQAVDDRYRSTQCHTCTLAVSTEKTPVVYPSTAPCFNHSLEMWCSTLRCRSQTMKCPAQSTLNNSLWLCGMVS